MIYVEGGVPSLGFGSGDGMKDGPWNQSGGADVQGSLEKSSGVQSAIRHIHIEGITNFCICREEDVPPSCWCTASHHRASRAKSYMHNATWPQPQSVQRKLFQSVATVTSHLLDTRVPVSRCKSSEINHPKCISPEEKSDVDLRPLTREGGRRCGNSHVCVCVCVCVS